MQIWFDHLVIGAANLDQGAIWAENSFGARPPMGGAHPLMGTHNLLTRFPHGYLEIISADPAATPQRRRWYGMDDPDQQARMAERPRPIAFVLATDDLEAAVAAAEWDAGEIIDVRRGELNWRMAVRADGAVAEGVLPVLIEWPESIGRRAPTERMADLGLSLRALTLKHPESARIRALLASLEVEEALLDAGAPLICVEAETPSLEAMIAPASIDARR